MNLPESLLKQIEDELKKYPLKQLVKGAEELSLSYREQREKGAEGKPFLNEGVAPAAYLALRFPATFAAIVKAMSFIKESSAPYKIESLLDIGSGPGTAFFAADTVFQDLKSAHLLEVNDKQIEIGERLMKSVSLKPTYIRGKFQESLLKLEGKRFDLVTAAYALSELKKEDLRGVIEAIWKKDFSYFLIVEPGSSYGFKTVHAAREILISLGAHIIAPCTHENKCPLFGGEDFCHFAVRLIRPDFQRKVKEASLGYEDEKFSFLLVSKKALSRPVNRLVKSLEKHSGHLVLTLCNERGLEKKTISKKHGDLYKLSKKLEWGDSLDII